MSALYPTLLTIWLPVLIGVPVLIHLINLMRHRKVRWAAMSFLLESQKKNQNWVRFKEILLLLTRMAAMAAIVVMLAGPLASLNWSRLFSGGLVHHVLLIDDSLSMSDQWSNTTAIKNARNVVDHLLERTAHHQGTHLITLLRFSEAAAGRGPDIVRQRMRADLPQQKQSILDLVRPSQLAAGPLEAIKAVKEKIGQQKDENLVVYLISDFRSTQWRDAKPLQEAIRTLTDAKAKVELVRCVDRTRPNLAITALAPAAGVLAADVPLKFDVEVTNYDVVPVRNVQVLLESQTNLSDSPSTGRQALPALTIERIEPGQTARQSFSARFPTAGDHEIYARLGADALTADNQRFCVVRLPAEIPLLIVDGQPGSIDAQLLSLPRQKVRTGLKSQVVGVNYLREQPLDKFAAIFLVNIATLDAGEVATLKSYVASGGSVVFFASESTRPDFVTQSLYDNGKGFFPLPLSSQASLIVDRLEKTPDLEVDLTHPIFQRTFAGSRNSFLNSILVDRYFASPKGWAPAKADGVRVLAGLRGQAPLIVEKHFGQGLCLAVLTTAAPVWNNWASNPSFVIALMEMKVYLTIRRAEQPAYQVGQSLSVPLPKDQYSPEVEFVRPVGKSAVRETIQAKATDQSDRMRAAFDKIEESGIYEARLKRTDGATEIRRFAANVPPGEGNLAVLNGGELKIALADVPAVVHEAVDFSGPIAQQAELNLGSQWWFLAIVIGILTGELLLAYSASYHPVAVRGRA